MLFALVPLSGLADKNTTAYPVTGSGNTYICPMKNNCCYNPGEDSDGNAVVRAPAGGAAAPTAAACPSRCAGRCCTAVPALHRVLPAGFAAARCTAMAHGASRVLFSSHSTPPARAGCLMPQHPLRPAPCGPATCEAFHTSLQLQSHARMCGRGVGARCERCAQGWAR